VSVDGRSTATLLLKLVRVKALCRRAHVEKLDAGARGLTLEFRDNSFANPTGLGW
jgi:transcription-repair coupling factor (superfamily II helicase)